MTGHGWGFLAWSRHAAIAPTLREADLGSSELDGQHRVLIDRETRKCYLVGHAVGDRLLKGRWSASEPVVLTPEEAEELVNRVRQAMQARRLPSATELIASMRKHSATVAALVRWLDEWTDGRQDQRRRDC